MTSVPPWLPDFLSDWSFELVSACSIEEISPTRQEMRNELVEIWRLANLLDSHLQNSAVTGLIAVSSGADFHEVSSDSVRHLNQLRSRIRQALKSPELVDENGETIRGRGKPLLPNAVPPKRLCAGIIAEVIDFLCPDKDSRPPLRKACSAADKLWGAWFKPNGWGKDRLNCWKDYFRALDEPRLQSFRSEVRRVLSITAHHYVELSEEK
ncbi:MAG: hypothetical protein WA831_10085 [Methylovirgula sp.]